jgi:acylphosphatase
MAVEIKTIHLIISGRVQGVCYRVWVVEQATKRGLSGWVRNRLEGTVEALFSGSANAVEELIAECYQGPSFARVDHIELTPANPPADPVFKKIATC